ncbi:AraC family transcriptional regulator [Pseudohalioglobus sediminis]|uniref:AraC family transcriptional regulator n=1 Tax=Pseudohalioglobus sediminis TaxID=2606449 RepID=A0A5B0WPL4_9GAMM|nr:AraC family transcriptional regulator [Pseudohalioglobus sediminis]KAA1188873.1 AraC family transcriptional regulator [Pseudohalioglobus sediminis]
MVFIISGHTTLADMDTGTIPLIRGSQLSPFINYLHDCGIGADKLLRVCRCPLREDFDNPDLIIPTNRLWQFIEEAARVLRDKDLGWKVAMRYGVYGGGHFGYQLENQPSLREAIRCYSSTISEHASVSHGQLEAIGGNVWFYRATLPRKGSAYFQVEQYALGTLVHIVKRYLGRQWRPKRIAITTRPSRAERLAIAASCDELITGAARAAIEVPVAGLDATPGALPASIKEPGIPAKPFPDEVPHILTQMLMYYIGDYPITLNVVSDILEMHPRTLNRRLETYGLSFRDVRKQVLIERAKWEINRATFSIEEISRLLGYSHQSSFSRAFAAIVGVPPREFAAHATD